MPTETLSPNAQEFFAKLDAISPGEAHSDKMSRGLYATDASIYQQTPAGYVTPRTVDELKRAQKLAFDYAMPVLPRGGGTSLAGQTTAIDAIVIDTSKHLNKLEEVNEKEMWARVQPGLVRDELNTMIASKGIWFAPETSTSNRANIGGMIGNNSSGMMSVRYGTTISHVLGLNLVLADGSEVYFGRRSEMDKRGVEILDRLLEIIRPHRALIEEKFPKVIRRVGGYSLDHFLTEDPNLAMIICGSEGTLGLMTSAKVRLVPKPKVICAMAIHFHDIIESLRATPLIVKHKPLSAEFMDGPLIRMSQANISTGPLCFWVDGKPEAVIPVEMDGDTAAECIAKLEAIEAELRAAGFGYSFVKLYKPEERAAIIEVRKAGLGVMLKAKGDKKAISFIEDACVPVEHLADYTQKIYDLCKQEGVDIMTYGHASVGVLHLKPVVNLKSAEDRAKCERISRAAMEICRSYKGSWSGEHGDGIARGWQNTDFWGETMIGLFREIKKFFDPKGIMNPGKIFDTPDLMGPLRYTGDYKKSKYEGMFKFREEGGMPGAVEMCNGVGACRKFGTGTMCPSYMATREEKDSTRGRANALRLALTGQMDGGLSSDELYNVMDLCLSCKACKSECPSNVDMSKMKAEFLHQHHKAHGTSMREKLFAFSPDVAKMNAGLMAPIVNMMFGIPLFRKTVNGFLGIAVERDVPAYAAETLPAWFAKRTKTHTPETAKEVVLFDDTYANYHETDNGRYAVRVLEHLGYKVRLARAGCCQRPLISKGFLDEAKVRGAKTMQNLHAFTKRGIPVVTLEPSCTSALRDDLPDLIDDEKMGREVREGIMPIDEFLDREVLAGRLKIELPEAGKKYLLHGHCHQKALNGTGPMKRLFGSCDGKARLNEVDSGCCGMAGSFGYEQEHYDISQKIGESRLFPAVRATPEDQPIIASGFSCRHQIKDATGRKPEHFIVAFGKALGLGEE